ncbi:hypothetical protein [Devosia sp.]|uniref:hypothetical protein n=1 Tax=Devosia sp. TaxID=1871048 RepID=UPI003267D1C0
MSDKFDVEAAVSINPALCIKSTKAVCFLCVWATIADAHASLSPTRKDAVINNFCIGFYDKEICRLAVYKNIIPNDFTFSGNQHVRFVEAINNRPAELEWKNQSSAIVLHLRGEEENLSLPALGVEQLVISPGAIDINSDDFGAKGAPISGGLAEIFDCKGQNTSLVDQTVSCTRATKVSARLGTTDAACNLVAFSGGFSTGDRNQQSLSGVVKGNCNANDAKAPDYGRDHPPQCSIASGVRGLPLGAKIGLTIVLSLPAWVLVFRALDLFDGLGIRRNRRSAALCVG